MAWNIPRYWEICNAGPLPPLEDYLGADAWMPRCLEEPVREDPLPPVVLFEPPVELSRRLQVRVPCRDVLTYLPSIQEEVSHVEKKASFLTAMCLSA